MLLLTMKVFLYRFDLLGGVIGKLTDHIHELKSEIQSLKDFRINCASLMEDNYVIKEELLEIKDFLKKCKLNDQCKGEDVKHKSSTGNKK